MGTMGIQTYKRRRRVNLILLVNRPVVLPAPPIGRAMLATWLAARGDRLPRFKRFYPGTVGEGLSKDAGSQGQAGEDGLEEAPGMHWESN